MKYRYWMAGALLILGLLAVYLHRSRYVAITVSNVGDLDLQAVVAHIGGNNIQLGSIIPGASARGSTVPQADSDVSLTFKTGGDVVELHLNSYVTNGYCGSVDVQIAGVKAVSCQEEFRIWPPFPWD